MVFHTQQFKAQIEDSNRVFCYSNKLYERERINITIENRLITSAKDEKS